MQFSRYIPNVNEWKTIACGKLAYLSKIAFSYIWHVMSWPTEPQVLEVHICIWLTVLSVIRNLNLFKSLITGKSSYMLTALPCWLGWCNYFQMLTVFFFVTSVSIWKAFAYFTYGFGSHLLSHTVTSAVPSAAWVLTIVFGMGTGVSPKRIATESFCILSS